MTRGKRSIKGKRSVKRSVRKPETTERLMDLMDPLAVYIVEWLRSRNAAQLDPAISAMSVEDYELLHDELAHILKHGGHPPNWIKR
jgi:hypothetical protein